MSKKCKCKLCNVEYECCRTCEEAKKNNQYIGWRTMTESMEHYKIYTILLFYARKQYSKEEAQELLLRMDISDIDTYTTTNKKLINEILQD